MPRSEPEKVKVAMSDRQTNPNASAKPKAKPEEAKSDEKVRVRIARSFILAMPSGRKTHFKVDESNCGEPGVYEVTPEEADHWFLKQHCENPPKLNEPVIGTPAYISAQQRAHHVRELHEARLNEEVRLQVLQLQEARAEKIRKALGHSFEQSPRQ